MKHLLNEPSRLEDYQSLIHEQIQEVIPKLGPPSRLRDACEYALLTGGKRFRPALVLLIADSLGKQNVLPAALAIEVFHTASLIADDLPCMDNDRFRREKPTVHVQFDEATALLASYALIAAGYQLLAENAAEVGDPQRGLLAVQVTSQNTGLMGAAGGQYDDIFPSNLSVQEVTETIYKKTVTLFEIAFFYGWVFGGGDLDLLPLVKKASNHFGLAFQIADDLGDCEQDKANGRDVNMGNLFGLERAREMFHVELYACQSCLDELGMGLLGNLFAKL